MTKHDLIPLSDRGAWTSALEGIRHGFGHTWESCHAFSLTHGLPTFLYRYRRCDVTIACPLVVRTWNRRNDVTTPFGFSGFAASRPTCEFSEAWYSFARREGWVCAYIAQNPQLEAPTGWTEEVEDGQRLFWLDLRLGENLLFSRLSRCRRRQIKKWNTDPGWLTTDRAAILEFILRNHAAFFDRLGAARSYRFATETWNDLACHDNVLLLGAQVGGNIVAATVFGCGDRLADALFNISVAEGRDAATVLMWEGARHLMGRGIDLLNMGGGLRPDDPLEDSKSRFNPIIRPVIRLKQVFDPQGYRALCEIAGCDANDRAGFFPPFHRP